MFTDIPGFASECSPFGAPEPPMITESDGNAVLPALRRVPAEAHRHRDEPGCAHVGVHGPSGSLSGVDMTVALVEKDFGKELARRVAQGLVMYLKRPGNQAQFSLPLSTRFAQDERFRELQGYVLEHPDRDMSVETLAERVGMSPRN